MSAGDELTALRAYESGSDHHLPNTTGYVLLRAVLATVSRRVLDDVSARHLYVGAIHVGLAARAVDVAGALVRVSRLEFELLVVEALAGAVGTALQAPRRPRSHSRACCD